MLHRFKPCRPVAAIAGFGLAFLLAAAAAASPVMVTVSGAIENPNRGALEPERDALLAFYNIDFEAGHALTLAALQAMPQRSIRADFPLGGAEREFTGVAVEDLLQAVGATGETLWLQALDGYALELSAADLVEREAILALTLEGEPLGIGEYGPAMLAFPRAEREALVEMNDDWWIWQVFHIGVE